MAFRVLAIIPARAGSRGLRHKNIRRLGGVPLLVHAVRLARQSRRPGEQWHILVSTDSVHYRAIARRAGASAPFLRPRHLATARAPLAGAVFHAMHTLTRLGETFDAVLLLSATTPLTATADVRRAVAMFRSHRRSVVSVCVDPIPDGWRFSARRGRLVATSASSRVGRRQQAPLRYQLNGAVYVASPAWLQRHRRFLVSGQTQALVMPRTRSLDIEDEDDLAMAGFLMLRNSKRLH
jgi:CMP-N,N'-diacetyllegionaminic acid synthase